MSEMVGTCREMTFEEEAQAYENEIALEKEKSEKIISILQEENKKLNKELEKYRVIKSVTNMILRGDAE